MVHEAFDDIKQAKAYQHGPGQQFAGPAHVRPMRCPPQQKEAEQDTESRTLKVRGGIISQANRYLGGFCSSQRIFPPQISQVLLEIRAQVKQAVPPCIDLQVLHAVGWIAGTGEHVVPLEHLMQQNSVEEPPRPSPHSRPAATGKESREMLGVTSKLR